MADATVAYSAIGISIFARFIFMYLLYTKKSVNDLSLTFCLLNIASSGLWIKYSLETNDMPLTIRNSVDGVLLSLSAAYIIRNKCSYTISSMYLVDLAVDSDPIQDPHSQIREHL